MIFTFYDDLMDLSKQANKIIGEIFSIEEEKNSFIKKIKAEIRNILTEISSKTIVLKTGEKYLHDISSFQNTKVQDKENNNTNSIANSEISSNSTLKRMKISNSKTNDKCGHKFKSPPSFFGNKRFKFSDEENDFRNTDDNFSEIHINKSDFYSIKSSVFEKSSGKTLSIEQTEYTLEEFKSKDKVTQSVNKSTGDFYRIEESLQVSTKMKKSFCKKHFTNKNCKTDFTKENVSDFNVNSFQVNNVDLSIFEKGKLFSDSVKKCSNETTADQHAESAISTINCPFKKRDFLDENVNLNVGKINGRNELLMCDYSEFPKNSLNRKESADSILQCREKTIDMNLTYVIAEENVEDSWKSPVLEKVKPTSCIAPVTKKENVKFLLNSLLTSNASSVQTKKLKFALESKTRLKNRSLQRTDGIKEHHRMKTKKNEIHSNFLNKRKRRMSNLENKTSKYFKLNHLAENKRNEVTDIDRCQNSRLKPLFAGTTARRTPTALRKEDQICTKASGYKIRREKRNAVNENSLIKKKPSCNRVNLKFLKGRNSLKHKMRAKATTVDSDRNKQLFGNCKIFDDKLKKDVEELKLKSEIVLQNILLNNPKSNKKYSMRSRIPLDSRHSSKPDKITSVMSNAFTKFSPDSEYSRADIKLSMTPKVVLRNISESGKKKIRKGGIRRVFRFPVKKEFLPKTPPLTPSFSENDACTARSSEENIYLKNKVVPMWESGVFFKQALLNQHYERPSLPERIFGLPECTVDLVDVFGIDNPKYHFRTSSADWF